MCPFRGFLFIITSYKFNSKKEKRNTRVCRSPFVMPLLLGSWRNVCTTAFWKCLFHSSIQSRTLKTHNLSFITKHCNQQFFFASVAPSFALILKRILCITVKRYKLNCWKSAGNRTFNRTCYKRNTMYFEKSLLQAEHGVFWKELVKTVILSCTFTSCAKVVRIMHDCKDNQCL